MKRFITSLRIYQTVPIFRTIFGSGSKGLKSFINSAQNSGVTLRQRKCPFAVSSIDVFGRIVSSKGIQPEETQITAIPTAPRLNCAVQARSFLGLTKYCSRHIENYSSITYPLGQVTNLSKCTVSLE